MSEEPGGPLLSSDFCIIAIFELKINSKLTCCYLTMLLYVITATNRDRSVPLLDEIAQKNCVFFDNSVSHR